MKKRIELKEISEVLKNPGRGWYQIYEYIAGTRPLHPDENIEDGLALLKFHIGKYKAEHIPDEVFEQLREQLLLFRKNGMEVILRPVYDNVGKGLEAEPEDFDTVKEHAEQISEFLHYHENTVFILQGLLVGSWGEMHGTRYADSEHLRELWDILRPYADENMFLSVRKPVFVRWLEENGSGYMSRPGVFNDAIFGSETDLGTYAQTRKTDMYPDKEWSRKAETAFLAELNGEVPFGGEALRSPYYDNFFSDVETIRCLRNFKTTYLNRIHDRGMIDLWKQTVLNGNDLWKGKPLYDFLTAHIGYRFVVRSAELHVPKIGTPSVSVVIENTGFAPAYRKTETAVIINGREYVFPEGDLRVCGPGETVTVKTKLPGAGKNILSGELYLHVTDTVTGGTIRTANPHTEQGLTVLR